MFVAKETFRKSARMAYSFLFILSMLTAWILRDFAKPVLDKLPCMVVVVEWAVVANPTSLVCITSVLFCNTGIIHGDVEHSERWYGQQAVYRVSLGSFVRRVVDFWGMMIHMYLTCTHVYIAPSLPYTAVLCHDVCVTAGRALQERQA